MPQCELRAPFGRQHRHRTYNSCPASSPSPSRCTQGTESKQQSKEYIGRSNEAKVLYAQEDMSILYAPRRGSCQVFSL